ncbi:MAG: NUDIX domain-containing protein [Candidatus Competibacterales bacterium]
MTPTHTQRVFLNVDVVIFTVVDEALKVLLVKRETPPEEGRWALPGGAVDPDVDRDLDRCALRTLHRRVGCGAPYLEQLRTYGDGERDARPLTPDGRLRSWTATVVYFALVSPDKLALPESQGVRWGTIHGEGVADPLAFDHGVILRDAIRRLRAKLTYTAIAVYLLPERFTLPALQRTYEVLLQEKLDKSSFRKQIVTSGLVVETGAYQAVRAGRPPKLYRFNDRGAPLFYPRSPTGRP